MNFVNPRCLLMKTNKHKKQGIKSKRKRQVCVPFTLSPADTDLHPKWMVLVNAFGREFMVRFLERLSND